MLSYMRAILASRHMSPEHYPHRIATFRLTRTFAEARRIRLTMLLSTHERRKFATRTRIEYFVDGMATHVPRVLGNTVEVPHHRGLCDGRNTQIRIYDFLRSRSQTEHEIRRQSSGSKMRHHLHLLLRAPKKNVARNEACNCNDESLRFSKPTFGR